MLVNKKELADIIGVSERTLTDWQDKGMPIRVDAGRGRSNEYDTAAVIEWRVQFVAGGYKVESMKERKERLEGDRLELVLYKEGSTVLDAESMEMAIENAIAAARAEFMARSRKLKKKIDKEYGINVDLELLIEHDHATLTKLAEHTPEFGKADAAGMEEMGAGITN